MMTLLDILSGTIGVDIMISTRESSCAAVDRSELV